MMNFYRLCRVWHGYLSAAAFVWLLFFAVTGILLNHPDWLKGGAPAAESHFTIQPSDLAAIKAAGEPGRELTRVLRETMALKGDFVSADSMGNLIFVRLRGARGSSDLQLDLQSGRGSATVDAFSTATLFRELHRGERAGTVWRALIDISGALLAVTAIMGLLIYFSLRFRLRTALILVGAGLAAMAAALAFFVQ